MQKNQDVASTKMQTLKSRGTS